MSVALLFPGQGTQAVGMGRELAETWTAARETFERADAALGWSLSALMWGGSEDEPTETRTAQPAILVHSIAVHRVLRGSLGEVSMAAGHSLGEYSAYVAAGTLEFEDALRVVRLRGELMFDAGVQRPGTMAAVLALDGDQVAALCEEVTAGTCVAANYNAPGQVVLSGDAPGVAQGMELARRAGARRVVELAVSGAFHSPLMEPAEEGLRSTLEQTSFRDPEFPVVSNVTGLPVETGEQARALLVRQLTSPVRWARSIETMVDGGVKRFLELGPGRVLCGLNKRNAPDAPCVSLGTADDLAVFGAVA